MFDPEAEYDETEDVLLEARMKQEAQERVQALRRAREEEEARQRVRNPA